MSNRTDIRNRADIETMVREFYEIALADETIGYIFTDVARLNLAEHLPVIADFWEMLLLGGVNFPSKYGRSPMSVHVVLHQKEALTDAHFARWITLFHATVDRLFAGPTADLAKLRASGIAETMRHRVNEENSAGVRNRR